MNESSSYKHLTVILAALITTIIIAIIALVLLLTSPDTPSEPVTDPISVSDNASGSNGIPTSPNKPVTTTKPVTTPQSPTNTTLNGDNTTPDPTLTTPPDDGELLVPPSGPISGSTYGDKLGSLELYAEWSTVSYDAATGSCTLKLDIYCDSYSISIGPRFGNYLVINEQRVEFDTEQISVPTNDHKARTLLYSTEYEVQKDAPTKALPVSIEFGWHYQGRYSGEFAEWLTLKTEFVV